MKSLAYTLVCFASIASAHNYYDADVVRPLSHGKSVSYATDGNTVSATDTHSTRTDTASSSGLTPNTTAGVKTAVRELEAGMEELKGYSVDMAGQLQRNGPTGFIEMPKPLTDRGAKSSDRGLYCGITTFRPWGMAFARIWCQPTEQSRMQTTEPTDVYRVTTYTGMGGGRAPTCLPR